MKELKCNVLADRILVLPDKPETETKSGLYIPKNAVEKPNRGVVVSVGSGTDIEEMHIKKGYVVLYGKNSGSEIILDGETYLIMKQSDILVYYVENTEEG